MDPNPYEFLFLPTVYHSTASKSKNIVCFNILNMNH